jgi:hypothetical protein
MCTEAQRNPLRSPAFALLRGAQDTPGKQSASPAATLLFIATPAV